MSSIRVLVIDDSAIVRKVLSQIINETSGMEVIDTAQDPVFALKKLDTMKPDVITLDIEMPRMDGLTFLGKLMTENPHPVVMCSTLTQKSSEASVKALHLGAVEVVGKPTSNVKTELANQKKEIVDAIRAAANARLDRMKPRIKNYKPKLVVQEKLSADAVLPKTATNQSAPSNKLIAIGCSTGGTQALEFVLSSLREDVPGIVVVQHMPEAFTQSFANRLDSVSKVHVKQAENGNLIETGKVLIAPGGQHLMVENRAGKLYANVKQGPLVSRHRPSVDVLFRSVAQSAAKQSLGIIMTGMGDDGATGMKEMYDAGSFTLAQDEESCVIFGMPAVAIERGGVKAVTSLSKIPDYINTYNRPVEFKKYM